MRQSPDIESLRQRQELVKIVLLDIDHPVVHELQQQLHVPGLGVPHHNHGVASVAGGDGEILEYCPEPVTAGCQHKPVTLQALQTTLQGDILQG